MEVWLDCNVYQGNKDKAANDPTGKGVPPTQQPNLDEMTMAAIDVLSRNDKGFYLLVEAASIDKSAHPLDIPEGVRRAHVRFGNAASWLAASRR